MARMIHNTTLDYITRTFAPEDAALARIRAEGERRAPGMQVSAWEGQMLKTLLAMHGTKTVLEIGTFMGYSTLCMARALPEDGHIYTLELKPENAAQARAHFAQSDAAERITVLEGAALETLIDPLPAALQGIIFDAVFIDGAKKDYAALLDMTLLMLRQGGLVLGDNSLLFGAMAGEETAKASQAAIDSMTAFNARLADSAHFTSILIPSEEGLTVAVKK